MSDIERKQLDKQPIDITAAAKCKIEWNPEKREFNVQIIGIFWEPSAIVPVKDLPKAAMEIGTMTVPYRTALNLLDKMKAAQRAEAEERDKLIS